MNKFLLLTTIIFVASITRLFGQTFSIEANFNSTNGWMPDFVGDVNPPLNSPGPSYDAFRYTTNPNGLIYKIADSTNLIDKASTQLARFGGATADINFYTQAQAQAFIDFCTAKNLQPVFQIPFLYFYHNKVNVTDAITPANITQIKNMVTFLQSKGVIYYSISNESDMYHNPPFNKNGGVQLSAAQIASFFKPIAVAIKEVQPNAIIIGPDMAQPNFGTGGLMDGLIDKTPAGLTTNITGKIKNDPMFTTFADTNAYFCNIFSWHTYPFDSTQTRANVIANPSGFFQLALDKYRSRINGSSSNPNLKLAVTEINIDYQNKANNSDPVAGVKGVCASSFLAGQWLAECYGRAMDRTIVSTSGVGAPVNAMMPWSWHQSNGSGSTYDLGILDKTVVGNDYSQIKGRSTYWHMWMLRKFTSNYVKGFYSAGTVSPAPPVQVKTFANSEPAGFRVIVINQNDSSYNFRVNMDNSATTTAANQISLKYNFGLPSGTGYNSTMKIAGRSTILLTFDCNGALESRYDYSEADNLASTDPHLRAVGNVNLNPVTIACGKPMNIATNINSNTTFTNDTLYINSSVLITGSSELNFTNCLIVMAPGTQIKANPNASIVMKNSVMIGCNNQVYKGLVLNGNYHTTGERLLIENSFIIGASNPVVADKIADIKITGSVFANGLTGITLSRSQAYTIQGNIMANYNTAIFTSNTKKDYTSLIGDNRIIDVQTGIKMLNDLATKTDIICNSIKYDSRGISTYNTEVKEFGTPALSAGNQFIDASAITPVNYIDHNGAPTKYYYASTESAAFAYPVMNIPKIMAVSQRVCPIIFASPCANWIEPDGIAENKIVPSQMLVYPNPNQGDFTVSFKDLPKGNWSLTVYDVLGKLISSQKVNNNIENTTLRISSKGLYFVSLQSESNRITQKVIVE